MFLFIYDLFIIMHELGRKQLPTELCILLARIEIGSVFESEGPTECKIINVLGSNSDFAISS